VETPEQFDILAHLGCDQSQGYLHSRPLPVVDIEPLLRGAFRLDEVSKSPEVTPIARRR